MTTGSEVRFLGPPRRRRRWPRRLGWTLVTVGAVLLGYVGWQLYGTNAVSAHRQRVLTEALEQQWDHGQDTARVDGVAAGAVVRIPRFGADYAVPVVQGVGDDQLAAGFGHFPGTARAGQVGNYALAAHRITHGQPLRRMPELRAGDRIEVATRTRVYTYVLDTGGADLVVPFTAGWVVAPRPVDPTGDFSVPAADRLITLTTCSELFHTDDRMVAFGHLTTVRDR